jgi:hypothetical protein
LCVLEDFRVLGGDEGVADQLLDKEEFWKKELRFDVKELRFDVVELDLDVAFPDVVSCYAVVRTPDIIQRDSLALCVLSSGN